MLAGPRGDSRRRARVGPTPTPNLPLTSNRFGGLPVALQHRRFVQNYVEQVKAGREDLYRLCDELRIRYWRSAANFVLIQIGQHSEQFIAEMRRSGVAISDRGSDTGCRGCVRIHRKQMPIFR